MRILVTGANGFIGQHVIKQLNTHQFDYIATDYHFPNKNEKQIECDIFDPSIDFYNLFGCPEIVLHLAWRDGFIHNSDKHMGDLSNHYRFLKQMIDNGVKHVAVLGTMHEIGFYEGEVDERTPCNPLSQYGVAKNALRKSIELLCSERNITFQWIRAFYIISNDISSNSIFSKLIKTDKEGKQVFPFTSGTNKYDFIEVEELAYQILCVIAQNNINGIINCCSGKPISLGEKVEEFIIKNHLKIKLDYGVYPNRVYDSKAIWGSPKKIQEIVRKSLL